MEVSIRFFAALSIVLSSLRGSRQPNRKLSRNAERSRERSQRVESRSGLVPLAICSVQRYSAGPCPGAGGGSNGSEYF